MKLIFSSKLKSFLNIGFQSQLSNQENRRIKVAFWINLILMVLMLLSILVNLVLTAHAFYIKFIITFLILVINIILIKKGYYILSIISLNIFPIFILFFFPLLNSETVNQYYLWYPNAAILFSIIPHLLFSYKKDRYYLIPSILYYFLLMFFSELILEYFGSTKLTIIPIIHENFSVIKFTQIILFTFINIGFFYYNRMSSIYEKQLESKNVDLCSIQTELQTLIEELRSSNDELHTTTEELSLVNNKLNTSNFLLEKNNLFLEEKIFERTQELQESETRFRSIFEYANDAILIMKNDTFVDCNVKALELFGCSKEQLLNHTPMELSPEIQPDAESSIDKAQSKIALSLQGFPQRFEWQHIRFDNTAFDADVTLNKIELGTEVFLQAIVRDISEFNANQRALRESEEKFSIIFHNVPVNITISEAETGKFIDVNDETLKSSGYTYNEIVGHTSFEINWITPQERQILINEILLKGSVNGLEMNIRSKKGETLIALVSGEVIVLEGKKHFLLVWVDITERKKNAIALEQSEMQLRTLINTLPDLIWLKNAEGVYLQCNQRFENFFGATEKNIVGKTDYDFINAELADFFRTKDKLAMNKGMPSVNEEEVTFANDGHTEILETIKTPVLGVNGEIIGVLGIGRNISERKKSEEELRLSEEKFSKAFTACPVAISISYLNNGRYVDCNETMERLTGYSRDEIIDATSLTLGIMTENDRQKIIKEFGKTGSVRNLELDFKIKDGTILNALFSCEIIEYAGKACLLSVSEDITERKKTALALEQSEMQLRTLVNTLPDLIWLKNTEGIYLQCNQRFESFFGAKEKDIIGKTDYDFVNAELADFFRANDVIAMKKGKPSVNEEEVTFVDDGHTEILETIKTPVLDINGELIGVLGIGRNISERKKSEVELRLSEEKFSKAFNASPVAIGISKMSDTTFIEVNEALVALSGFSHDELIGTSIISLGIISLDERALFLDKLKNNDAVRGIEIKFKNKNGRIVNTSYSGEIINYNGDTCLLSVVEDITFKKELERRILEARIDAEELERAYFANELHDGIGPLLSTIRLYIQWLNKPKIKASKDEILLLADKTVQDTINAVKEISHKLTPNVLKTFGLITAVNSFIDRIKNTSNIEIEIINNIDSRFNEQIEITLYRLIIECINNTIKHAEAKCIKMSILTEDSLIIVRYSDDGKGFDYETTLKLGKGLGLFNIQNRVNVLGGIFKIQSELGKGVLVEVKIAI